MCLTKLLTSNNEMKTLQSNHVPPRTNNLVWLRGNAASSHPCKSSGSSYEEFPIPDGLVRSSRPTVIDLGGVLVDVNYYQTEAVYGNEFDDPPIHVASNHSAIPDAAELLLSRGANPLTVSFAGDTCLNKALSRLAFRWYHTNSIFFVMLMEAIAKAKAAKLPSKLVSRRELYMLTVPNYAGHTPLSKAKTLCITRRKIFHGALVKCGFEIDLFPPGEKCPAQKPSLTFSAPWCFCDEDLPLDRDDQSNVDSGSEERSDSVCARNFCHEITSEPGGSDDFQQLSSSAEQVST